MQCYDGTDNREGARIIVPMDHDTPNMYKNFSIPLIRMLGTNTSANGDKTILLNPGGPGGMAELMCRMNKS